MTNTKQQVFNSTCHGKKTKKMSPRHKKLQKKGGSGRFGYWWSQFLTPKSAEIIMTISTDQSAFYYTFTPHVYIYLSLGYPSLLVIHRHLHTPHSHDATPRPFPSGSASAFQTRPRSEYSSSFTVRVILWDWLLLIMRKAFLYLYNRSIKKILLWFI